MYVQVAQPEMTENGISVCALKVIWLSDCMSCEHTPFGEQMHYGCIKTGAYFTTTHHAKVIDTGVHF